MAFRVSYNFEGNPRTRPEQNLSGASQKLTRDGLLQKTYSERLKRQEQRLKLQNAELLQSHIRSYLVRKHKKNEERTFFDNEKQRLCISVLLRKFLFFYNHNDDDFRLNWLTDLILSEKTAVLRAYTNDTNFKWLMKRFMVICLRNLNNENQTSKMLTCIETFSNDPDTFEYLIKKGYYLYLKALLDKTDNAGLENILTLIKGPLVYVNSTNYTSYDEIIISEFCKNFLKPDITINIKDGLIPHLKLHSVLPFEKVIRHLSKEMYYFENTNNLMYCILALQPEDYEPSPDGVRVFASLTTNLHLLKAPDIILANDSDNDDDEDDEEDSIEVTDEILMLSDYLQILNNPEKVKKWIKFFYSNSDDEDIVMSFIKLCYNLLLVYRDSIRKYLLLYKLGLSSVFLNKLWVTLMNGKRLTGYQRSENIISSKDYRIILSVFCDMFTFYTETLTDRENSDTSETFTTNDLYEMSKMLQRIAIDLIEMAFPMCKSNMIQFSSEILHLYFSCLKCVKMLYMLDIRKKFCPQGFWTSNRIHISHDLARKNYLSKTMQPFFGIVRENNDDEHLPPLSTIEQRSLAILQQLPFLVMFTNRVLLLRELCRYSVGSNEFQRLHHDFLGDNVVTIRRTHLYEDAFEKLSTKSDDDFKHRIRIQFVNNAGLNEAGIDGGGIFKEFINEVLKTAFDPNRGFFLLTTDNTLYPNPNVQAIVDNFKEHYYFIGRLIGKAIFENVIVDLPLAEFFLVKLLIGRASAHYLKFLDPVLYRNLLYLRDYTGDVSDLGLDFTVVNTDLGETKVMELKPFGRNIPVTNENRLEYIQRLADLKLNIQVDKQCIAFREGLNSVVPLLWLRLFNHNELQVIVGGDNQEIDLIDLRAHTVYGGEFTSEHPTIVLFWKILRHFTGVQKKQLLKFVTSCSRPPLLGFKELNPPFCIHSAGNEGRMPTASTCLNLLKLPIITDKEVLREKLLAAIEQQAGFELS